MGPLKLPPSGSIYFDANAMIYSVEKIEPYLDVLQEAWDAAESGRIEIVSSEILLLETLVRPLRDADDLLESVYRDLLLASGEVRLFPVELTTIDRAARIRADAGLKTPDAIHAATALEAGVRLFVTNDPGFRRVDGLPLAVLSEFVPTTADRAESAPPAPEPADVPTAFPIREVRGRGWEVLIVPEELWLTCESKEDAEAIAAAPLLEYQALERTRTGAAFAAELERTSVTMARYRMGFGSRFFLGLAQRTRGN